LKAFDAYAIGTKRALLRQRNCFRGIAS